MKTATILLAVRDQLEVELAKLDMGYRTRVNAPEGFDDRYSKHGTPAYKVFEEYLEARERHKLLNPHSFETEWKEYASRKEAGYSFNMQAEGLYRLRDKLNAYIKEERT